MLIQEFFIIVQTGAGGGGGVNIRDHDILDDN